MQRLKWKISHKGLILVLIPLLVEIALVAALFRMLSVADKQGEELTKSREVVALASDLDNTLAYAGYALISWKMVQSEQLVQRYDALIAHTNEIRKRMKEVAQYRRITQDHVAGIDKACSKIVFLTSNFRRPDDSPVLLMMNKGAYFGQIQHVYGELYDKTRALINDEENVQVGSSNMAKQTKSVIYSLIGIAVLFNGFTVALALFLSRGITQRIAVLSENAKRLSQGQPLAAPVRGDDEIASLDRVFHKMAKDLHETEARKQEFVAMITHDLRSPLTSIRTISSTLAERAELRGDEEDGERIRVLQRSLDRMITLVNDLLDIDKIEAGLMSLELSRFRFKDILDAAVESVRDIAVHRQIKIMCSTDDTEAEFDQKRMLQILVNLIANAIKFSPRNSTVSVVAKADGNSLLVKVIDSGRGIPEDELNIVFDRFKQVEAADSSIRGGTGLGLAITKALVELHKGTIGVDSNAGGSTFWFAIPLR